MYAGEQKKVSLSKGTLDMKFMKKTKERVEKELDDAEGQAMYSKEITEEMRKAGKLVFIDTSITSCKDLIEGRLSFGGMNPDIEKMMENEYGRKLVELEKKKETDIDDAEMAQQYSSTVTNTVGKKFKTKKGDNRGNRNSRKFMKPSGDF